jgi:2-dehydro-3-deoxygalactonokinase
VSHAADAEIVGVNWGSSNFRAWRIAGDGSVLDEIVAAKGVAGLNREGMAEAMAALAARWPDHGPIMPEA